MVNDFEIHDTFIDDPDIMSLDVDEIDSFFEQTFYTDITIDKTSLSSTLSNLKNDNFFSSTELSLTQNNSSTTDENYLSLLKEVLNETKTKTKYEMMTSKQLFENHAVNETDIFFMKGVGSELASEHKKAWDILKNKTIEESKEDVNSTLTDEQMPTNHQSNLLDKKRKQPNKCYHLWDFLREILSKNIYPASICAEWVNENECEFRIIDTKELSTLWGKKKNSKTTMTYDKLSRTLRYYCSLDILTKVPGKRLHFKFSKGKMWTKSFKRTTKLKKARV